VGDITSLPVLADKDVHRVVSAAGLLASDKDGEALAAGRALCRLLAPHKISPADVFRAALSPKPEQYRRRDDRGGPHSGALRRQHVQLARMCLLTPQHLTDWERNFLSDIMVCAKLSPKQSARLQQIVRKVEMKRWEGSRDVEF
jgi:hypothetical protein